MSEGFEAEFYRPEKPDIRVGDVIRIVEGERVFQMRIDHVAPVGDPEHPLFPLGHKITGSAILESEEPERYRREWPQPEEE